MQPMKEKKQQAQAQQQKLRDPKTSPSTSINPNKKRNFWLGILTAAAIGFGGWSLFPPIAPDKDNLTDNKKAEIQQEYTAKGILPVNRITNPEEQKKAIASMGLDKEKEKELTAMIDTSKLDIAWIQAWDNFAEDGDVLLFESVGYTVEVSLLNKPAVFAIPLVPGENKIKVTGVHDGGGGITASVITSSGATSVPVIDVGQSYTLPLR